jgi:prophage tail gpP-like protein
VQQIALALERSHPGGTVEIKVGIQHVNREIVVETTESASSVEEAYTKAAASGGVLTLKDERGRKVLIQASVISYVDIGEESARRVGFGG